MKLALIFTSALLVSTPALANEACQKKMESLCPKTLTSREAKQCVRKNRAQLDEVCGRKFSGPKRDRKDARRGAAGASRTSFADMTKSVCASDIEKHCAEDKDRVAKVLRCLRMKKDSLSDTCRDHLQMPKGHKRDKKKNG